MARKPLTARQKLDNLTDAMVEDIMSLSDEELRAELIEDGIDPDALGLCVERVVKQALLEARMNESLPGERT